MLLAGIDTSFDFDFNDYLHSRFLIRGTSSLRNLLGTLNRRSLLLSRRKLPHLFRNYRVLRFRK